MSQSNDNSSTWLIAIVVIGLVALLGSFGNNGPSTSTSTQSTPSVDRGSFEHRYVQERFKQEGYSASESQQAADAVIKFHNAQKARKQ